MNKYAANQDVPRTASGGVPAPIGHMPPRLLNNARSVRWALVLGGAAMVGIGLVLFFMLTLATSNQALYEVNYSRLLTINLGVASVLGGIILWGGVRLVSRVRRNKFGSRLLLKLAAIFALVGFAPGLLIYFVSYQFVSRSIETWFDARVETALGSGLNLGRLSLEALSNDMSNKGRASAQQLAGSSNAAAALILERQRSQLDADDLQLWSASGQLLASAGDSRFQLSPRRPSSQQMREARAQQAVSSIEGLDDATATSARQVRVQTLAVVPASGFDLRAETRYVQITQRLPETLVTNALQVQDVYREYQERALARDGLRGVYIGTLTLSLFLAVFGAILLAVLLGNQLVRPLLWLAEGVRDVAGGNLAPRDVMTSRDELSGLTRSFASMTQQLADTRAAVEASIRQVSDARANLQTILDNLTSGVVVLDAQGRIVTSNPGATRILRVPLAAHEGQRLHDLDGLAVLAQGVEAQFQAFLGEQEQHAIDHWQQAFELTPGHGEVDHGTSSLLARGALLPGERRLLVLEDISEIVSAQRTQAWGEVARRLAHEIKNPLTPIQLSAERLELKLHDKLEGQDRAILLKSVKTIVDQVDAMKRLVNEFRDYARLPRVSLARLDINALVTDVLHLYESEQARVGVRAELDAACPPIMGDAQQLRQVVHNLLQNAQDATEGASPALGDGGPPPALPDVVIRTLWNAETQRVRLQVRDSGPGFAEHILKRAFEPYVTTKPKGTGLGLPMVKKIAEEHGTRVDIANRVIDGQIRGAQVSLSFKVAA
ncbi:MAG: Signal transduction histidine-protein kinase AtoS [Paracidovorax wautersii]|uniref:histidine kinase n=1 Tax=Paracidovorax wautersii TaxID=1177982 RepID=A0A7V8JP70_9BURK|nr:MAG: Signal transduction histidine-protein kinase AtoS [Paracidovorax wautersii]